MTNSLTLNKVAAALVGVAMVAGVAFAFTATRAHAVTLSELVELFIALEVIPADKADEARTVLSGQEETTPTTPTTPAATMSCNFTRNLTVGATGQDVMDLQKLLNLKGIQVAMAGAGSPGMESSYFGPATKAAVAKMQEAYAAEILTPLGLSTGTGYFGASTRAKANALCAEAPTTPTDPTVPGDDDDDTTTGDDDDTDLSGGEATLSTFKRLNSPSNVDIGEGQEEVKVAGFEFDVEDADIAIKRVYVNFDQTATASLKPWDYFETVQLMLGDEVIAESDASSKSDWEDLSGSDAYQLRFTDLNEKVSEDETAELYVVVTTLSNIDSDDEDAVWEVSIPDNGVRVVDGAGIDTYTGEDTVVRTFNLEAAGDGEELKVALSTSNPDSSVIKVDETSATNDVTVLVFELKAEESEMEITELSVLLTTSDLDIDDVVSDVKLEVDGTNLGDISSAGVGTTTVFEFDSGDFVIEKDSKVTVKVIVDLNQLTGNYAESTTLSAELGDTEVDAIDAEGADILLAADLTGTAIGEEHSLQSAGIFAEIDTITETSKSDGTVDDAVGEFKLKFNLTSFEDTYYVSATTTSVFAYDLLDSDGDIVTASSTAAITSTATETGDAYRIDDGTEESFTLTVTVNPDVEGNYRVRLNSVDFGISSTNTTNETAHTVAPAEDFRSDFLYLNV
jgi:peptidoglycan hydrolase-like protein with peptidoglycan-binding domain